MSQADIVVLGNSNVDLTAYLPHTPTEGETVIATDFQMGLGGKGANQAVAASRAGAGVSFIGALGDDSFATMMRTGLEAENIDLEHLLVVPGPSANATIWVEPSGANRIAVFLGASAHLEPDSVGQAVGAHPGAGYFISQLELHQDVVHAGLVSAKAAGLTTVLNTAPFGDLQPGILEHTDWLIANEIETEALLAGHGMTISLDGPLDDILAALPDWASAIGCHLIVTLGSHGAVGYRLGERTFFTPAPAVTPIDTVGAGDCCVGYFVALLSHGFSWQQALHAAVHAASSSVERPGAQASYPAASEAEAFFRLAREANATKT